MPDWLAILKAYVDTLETIVGTEGGVALANKLTAARAALLDQITALRLAELDAANLPADVDLIKGYTDSLEGAVGAIEGATTLHNKLTAARAGYLDELAAANLPTDIDAIKAALYLAAGITTWLSRSLPGDGISLSEAVRYTAEVKPEWAARASATHNTVGASEETILTTAYTVPGLFYFNLTLRNMVAGDDFTIRVYKRVDGINYDLKSEQNFVDAPTVKVYEIEGLYTDGTEFIRVTIQRNSATNRAFPYSYNVIKQPVA